MAALTNSAPFQNALKPCPRRNAVPHRRVLVCKAQAGEAEWSKKLGVHLLAAGIALSATLGHPNVAEAGVVFTEPKTRKLFQGQKKPPAPKPAEAASSGGGISLPSVSLPSVGLPGVSLPSLPTPDLSGLNVTPGGGGIDPRVIALPGAILGIAGAGFAAYTLDGGFRSMMKEGLVKDSSQYAGYEEAIDDYAAQAAGAASKGTKRISKAAKKTTQKGKQKAKQATNNGGGGLFGFLKK